MKEHTKLMLVENKEQELWQQYVTKQDRLVCGDRN
jgi:hypothetical protein